MYALFEGDRQIGSPFSTEKEVWEAALIEGLVPDVPVADEEGGQIIPADIMSNASPTLDCTEHIQAGQAAGIHGLLLVLFFPISTANASRCLHPTVRGQPLNRSKYGRLRGDPGMIHHVTLGTNDLKRA
jgi:hypothetical protein